MKLIKLQCPNCGASLETRDDMKKFYCSYCGTPILLDDESININIRQEYIDRAKVDEIALEKTKFISSERDRVHKQMLYEEKSRIWEQKRMLVLIIIAVTFTVVALINDGGELSHVLSYVCAGSIIFGLLFLSITKPHKDDK